MTEAPSIVLASGWTSSERRKAMAAKSCNDFNVDSLQEMVRTYVMLESAKGARTSPQTLRAYASGIRIFLAFCRPDPEASPDVVLHRCTRDDVRKFVYTRQLAVAPESVRLNLSAVRVLFRALVWAGVITSSPAETVSAPPDPRPKHERRDPVALDAYKRLLEAVSARDTTLDVKARDLALVRVMGDAGLRVSEVAALQIADVDLRQGLLTVQRGKGGKRRRLPLTRPAVAALKAWLELHPRGEGAIFLNLHAKTRRALLHAPMSTEAIRGVLAKLYEAAGLENQGCHALRHTAGTRLYAATSDIYKVSQVLGHSSVETSAIYSKMDLTGLRSAVDLMDDI